MLYRRQRNWEPQAFDVSKERASDHKEEMGDVGRRCAGEMYVLNAKISGNGITVTVIMAIIIVKLLFVEHFW